MTTPDANAQYPTSVTRGGEGYVGYPKNDTYQFGEFAYLVVETGGYCDLSAVDPYSGDRFWVGNVLKDDPSPYDALRRLVDAMEREHFLDQPEV